MISRSLRLGSLMLSTAVIVVVAPATAQQVNGVPGSPGATTTIDGKQLPPPEPKFGGVISDRASESTPWWPLASYRQRALPMCCSL
jgi:hypothetical protein